MNDYDRGLDSGPLVPFGSPPTPPCPQGKKRRKTGGTGGEKRNTQESSKNNANGWQDQRVTDGEEIVIHASERLPSFSQSGESSESCENSESYASYGSVERSLIDFGR